MLPLGTKGNTSAVKHETNNACNCTPQFYIILALSASIFRLELFAILQARRIKLCRGQLFSNAVKIILFIRFISMFFISDILYFVPIKLCKTSGSIHPFKYTGICKLDKVMLKKYYIWDILEINWKEVKVMYNGNLITLTKSVTTKF